MRFAQFVINQIKNDGYDVRWDDWSCMDYYVNKNRTHVNDNWCIYVSGSLWKSITLMRGSNCIDLTSDEKKFFINMHKEYQASIRLKKKNAKIQREIERKKAQDWP